MNVRDFIKDMLDDGITRALLLVAALIGIMALFTGCATKSLSGPTVERLEYPADGVTCWTAHGWGTDGSYAVSISCVKTGAK